MKQIQMEMPPALRLRVVYTTVVVLAAVLVHIQRRFGPVWGTLWAEFPFWRSTSRAPRPRSAGQVPAHTLSFEPDGRLARPLVDFSFISFFR